jgi:hypothetical protein
MGLFGSDDDTDEGAGSGDGGTTGTPSSDTKMEPAAGGTRRACRQRRRRGRPER